MTIRSFEFHPLTPDRWDDLEALFGPERGADNGCWCLWRRVTRRDWDAMGKAKRKAAFKHIVETGAEPGVLAYDGERPIGCCAVAPRASFPVLYRSPIARALDNEPVRSITCFYIDKGHRRRGLMADLIEAAVAFAGENGAAIIEAYPQEPREGVRYLDAFVGVASAFRACGFEEVARRRPNRPVMRRSIRADSARHEVRSA